MEIDMPITNFDKVELLLPMTGSNNGTTFTDFSLRQRTVTRTGVVTSTAQSKFSAYGSSGYFNGSSRLTVVYETGFDFSAANFTVEAWVRRQNSSSTWPAIIGKQNATADWDFGIWITNSNGDVNVHYSSAANGNLTISSASGALPLSAWVHVAVVRNGSSLVLYINGASAASATLSGNLRNRNISLTIGQTAQNNTSFVGNLQDLCITRGTAKYTANFTPPARMTQRTLTRVNSGVDSHEYDRAVLFDFNGGAHVGRHTTVIPDNDGNFEATGLIDLEYGVTFIRDGCNPICRGPYSADGD
jgi:hypothetical protein